MMFFFLILFRFSSFTSSTTLPHQQSYRLLLHDNQLLAIRALSLIRLYSHPKSFYSTHSSRLHSAHPSRTRSSIDNFIMHLVHFSPAILLALASVCSARPTGDASASAYEAILEASPAALSRNVEGRNIFLTEDNTCGKIGAGKNKGWHCDPMKAEGGACCSGDGQCGNGPKFCEAGCQKGFG